MQERDGWNFQHKSNSIKFRFLPTTYIKFNRVQIISARSLFENLYPSI